MIPRDAAGIPWYGPSLGSLRPDDPSHVTSVERLVGGTWVSTPFTVQDAGRFDLVVPDGGLRPGDRYTITVDPGVARRESNVFTITVGPEAVDPSRAELVLSARQRGLVNIPPRDGDWGECSDEVAADVVQARIAWPPELEPYREHLLYTVLVDGEPYDPPRGSRCAGSRRPGRSRRGPEGTELLFATCEGSIGLTPGPHAIAMHIETPDGREHVTPSQALALDCATSPVAPEPEPEPGPGPEPEPLEAAPPPVASPEPGGPPPIAGGCTLGVGARPWLLAPLLLVRRGRRGRRSSDP